MFTKRRKFSGGRATKTMHYVRDIVCLPKKWSKNPRRVSIPRKERRNFLAESGLFGKIEFDSDMSADEVAKEVCRVFAVPMGLTTEKIEAGERFRFTYLQRAGAGARTLCAPSVSSSFEWTGKQVSTLAKSGGIIYILANEVLPLLENVSYIKYNNCHKNIFFKYFVPQFMMVNAVVCVVLFVLTEFG